jgi:DNA-binding GntR family transcriptional regulator
MPSSTRAVSTPQRGAAVDASYEEIRRRIVRGRFGPGERLREATLAMQLGVSRTPVREALDRLERERFAVRVSTGRRVELAVAPLTAGGVRELWHLMAAIEGSAVAAVGMMGRATRRQLAASMAETNDELLQAVSRRERDADRIGALMSDFHQGFVDACAGPHTRGIYASIRPHVQRYEWAYGAQKPGEFRTSIHEHDAIIDAIGAGREALVRRLIEAHWHGGVARTIAVLRAAGKLAEP